MTIKLAVATVAFTLLAGCATEERGYGMSYAGARPSTVSAPAMDPNRKVAEQDCSKPIETDRGNVLCR